MQAVVARAAPGGVVAVAQPQRVVAGAAPGHVVPALAHVDQVVIRAAAHQIIAGAAQQRVVARAAPELHHLAARDDAVVARPGPDRVIARPGGNDVVARPADQQVVAAVAGQGVVAVQPFQPVVAGAAAQPFAPCGAGAGDAGQQRGQGRQAPQRVGAEIGQAQRLAAGRCHLDHAVAPGQPGAGGGGLEPDAGKIAQAAEARQVQPVDAGGEIGDPRQPPVGGGQEQVGPGAPGHHRRPRPADQDVIAPPACQRHRARASGQQVGAVVARQQPARRATIARGGQLAQIGHQPRQPR